VTIVGDAVTAGEILREKYCGSIYCDRATGLSPEAQANERAKEGDDDFLPAGYLLRPWISEATGSPGSSRENSTRI
jgi:hypothetical protein